MGGGHTCAIVHMYCMCVEYVVVCDSCKAVSNTYEAFLDISLEVKVSTVFDRNSNFLLDSELWTLSTLVSKRLKIRYAEAVYGEIND